MNIQDLRKSERTFIIRHWDANEGLSSSRKEKIVGSVLPKTETSTFMDQMINLPQKELPVPN